MLKIDPDELYCDCAGCERSRHAGNHRAAWHLGRRVSNCEWCRAEHETFESQRRALDWAAGLIGTTGDQLWARFLLRRLQLRLGR